MAIEGNLRTMSVPELLMWISQCRKSGTLEIRTGRSTERLAFEEGNLTYSSSSDRKKTLGRLLIDKGVVTEEMHEKARKLRKKDMGVAKALLELQLLSETVDGEFQFDERDLPQLQLLPLRVDVSNLLLRLTQLMDEKGEYDIDDASGLHWEGPDR